MREVTGLSAVRLALLKEESGRTKEGLEMVSNIPAAEGEWWEKVGRVEHEGSS